MAAAQSAYAEGTAVTATSTTWVDVCSISAGSFTAGKQYLILASAFARYTSSLNEVRMRLVHGSTPTEFTDASLAAELTADNQKTNFGWMYVFTQPGTAEAVTLQISISSTGTGTCDLGQIFALNLDDVGAQNTEWYYTEDTTDYTTTGSKVSKASITFTPNGTDDWLIIGNAMQLPGSVTANYQMDLNDSVAGALVSIDIEGEDTTNDKRGHLLMTTVTPSNASHTYSMRFSHETTAGTVYSNRIFALRLNRFSQHSFSSAAAQDTPAASPTWTTTRTLAPTPTVTGNWFIWGYLSNDVGTLTDDLNMRLQINASGGGLASDPNVTSDPGQDSWDATDIVPENIFKQKQLSSGASRTINLDVTMIAGTTLRVQERTLVAFSLELSGTTTNQSVTATSGSTMTMVRSAGKKVSATEGSTFTMIRSTGKVTSISRASTFTMVRSVNKSLAFSNTPAFTLLKQVVKAIAFTASSAMTMARAITTVKSIAFTAASALTMIRSTGKIVTATSATNRTITRSVGKITSITNTPTFSVVKQVTKAIGFTANNAITIVKSVIKSFAFTASSVASVLKSTGKIISTTGSNAVTRRAQVGKILTITNTPTATLAKQGVKIISATASSVVTLLRAITKSITMTTATLVTIVKQVAHSITFTSTTNVTIIKQTAKAVVTSVGNAVTLSTVYTVGRIISVSVNSTITLTRAVNKFITLSGNTFVSIVKNITHTVSSTAPSSVTVFAGSLFTKVVSVTSSTVVAMSLQVQKLFNITNVVVVTTNRNINKIVTISTAIVVLMIKQVMKTFTITTNVFISIVKSGQVTLSVLQPVVITFTKRAIKTFSIPVVISINIVTDVFGFIRFIAMNRNIGTIGLAVKNTLNRALRLRDSVGLSLHTKDEETL